MGFQKHYPHSTHSNYPSLGSWLWQQEWIINIVSNGMPARFFSNLFQPFITSLFS
jgi:hypothetical protein